MARARNSGVGMPFKVVSGAGVGAAAVVVGLSLAGPQALGVANADTAATDSTSVSAGPADPSAVSARSAVGRGGRGVKPSGSTGSRVRPRASADVTSAQQTPVVEAARRSVRGSVPSVPNVVSGVPELAVAVPSAAAVVADPARVAARAQRGAATRAAVAGAGVSATVPDGLQNVVEYVSGNILDSLHKSTARVVTTATAAAVVVAGPSSPAPVESGETTVFGKINAAINGVFDSVTNVINALPLGVFGDFLTGALQLVRRSLFNQAPSAVPLQWGQTISDVEGTLGAFDPEGDAITYTITTGPEYGIVTINDDGSYAYVPTDFTETGSVDSFTVGVSDSAWRLLGPITTTYVVGVTVNPASNPPAPPPTLGTQGFTLYNWTSGDLEYLRAERDTGEIDSGPTVGDKVGPGHSFHFEIDVPIQVETVVRPVFKDSTGKIWAIDLVTDKKFENFQNVYYAGTQSCYNDCNSAGVKSYPFGKPSDIRAEFLAPPNTVINVVSSDKQKQADVLNKICVGGAANCTYRITSTKNLGTGAEQLLGSEGINESDQVATKSYNYTVAASATTSWDVTASAKTTLFKLVEASLAVKYGQSWTTTATFSETLGQNMSPWSYGAVYARPYLTGVYGDFSVKLGNTTWNLKDVEFDYPTQTNCKDKVCKGAVIFRSEPLQRGFTFRDPSASLPFEPVYTVGGDPKPLLVTAFTGINNPPYSDYTRNMKYSTSDPAVATVSTTGALTPVGAGTATITATYSWKLGSREEEVRVTLPVKVISPL